jgi:hypothetical protein
MKKVQETRRTHGPLGQQLSSLPIVRGWMSTPAQNWMTVGSGRLVNKAKSLTKKISTEDRESKLGEDYISFVRETPSMFTLYSCPGCPNLI